MNAGLYDPADWYWAGSPGVYGSARGGFVSDPSTDAGYLAWQAKTGRIATAWPPDATEATTAASLADVLIAIGLPPTGLTPLNGSQLLAYANAKVQALLATSRSYAVAAAGGGSAATVKSDCSTATGADLLALNVWGSANPTATQPWVDDFGAVTTLAGAQFAALGLAVQAYGASVWSVMATAAAGIAATTITATAQIDALTWPA